MSYLRKGELLPIKGYNLSIPSIFLPEGYAFPRNMHYSRGEMRKRDGSSQLGNLATGGHKVLHLANFELSTKTVRLMRHTRYNLEKYNTASKKFENVTGIDLSGSETNFFSHCVVNEEDLYLYTNFADNIRKYDDGASDADLGGNPPKAKFIEYISPYVFIAHLEEGGLTIATKGAWCDTGQPEVWSGGNAGSQLFTDDPTEIRGAKRLNEFLFVYKEGMTYRGRLVGTADVFSFIPFSTGYGLYAPRTIADRNGVHCYMGINNFLDNNGIRIDEIGNAVREYVFNRLNRDRFETCFSIHVEEFKEVWFFVTIAGNDWPTEIWKYKYDMGFWYMDTCDNYLCGTNYKIVESLTWDDAIGTWDQQVTSWDDQAGQANAPTQVFGTDDGISVKRDPTKRNDNGTPYTAHVETRDYTGLPPQDSRIIGIEEDQEWMMLEFFARGSSCKVYYSTDEGDTWVFVEERQLTPKMLKYTSYFHVIAPRVRIKIENAEDGGDFTVTSIIPYYLDAHNNENPS